MATIHPFLTVPNFIADGLANGSMFRTGGVIQNSSNGQIVAWLRDADALIDFEDISLLSVMDAQGKSFGAASTFVKAAPFLMTFALTHIAIRDSERRIVDDLSAKIKREFWLDRMGRLDAARQQFDFAYGDCSAEEKQRLLREASVKLAELKRPIHSEIESLQSCTSLSQADGEQAFCLHLLAMYIYRMDTFCYLELDEPEKARSILEESLRQHEANLRMFVRKRIRLDTRAQKTIWKHHDCAKILAKYARMTTFEGYKTLIEWLGGHGYSRNKKQTSNRLSKLWRDTSTALAISEFDQFICARSVNDVILPQAFGLIENFNRLRGLALYLSFTAAPGRTYFQWETYEQSKFDGDVGLVTFVDMDALSRWP